MQKIYLDHSATTPLDHKVLRTMRPYFRKTYGNPSSLHHFGQEALAGVDWARDQAAVYFGCEPEEIIFTSGATESNNLAIKGLVRALYKQGLKNDNMHIITSLVEHDAILEPLMELQNNGLAVSHLPVDKSCLVDPRALKNEIRDNTVLVSVMWVNSEVGSVMPVRQLAKIVKNERERREREWKKLPPQERASRPRPIYFHTDATQAVNFFQCRAEDNFIDLLSMSAHKIYGPKGAGLLYKKKNVPLEPVLRGGHHENNFRSGTLNVPGIVGLGAALRKQDPKRQERRNKNIDHLRNMLVDGIMDKIDDVVLNTDRENSTPAHAHFSIMGVEGESLLISLDLEGIAVSTGSACASGSLKASHVLVAMGIDKETAHYSVRFTLGKMTTEADIRHVLGKMPGIVGKLREMNPVYNS